VAERLTIPGFVNAHSHAFQRALRGRTEGGDFWAWRESMLDVASGLAPGQVRRDYVEVYREQLGAGYTAVGEFHYLGLEEAVAASEAAEEAGTGFVLLYAAYARGGIERFRQESVAEYLRQLEALRDRGIRVGVAPHSVRACPPSWLEELANYAVREALPLHVHADEQPREIDECLAEQGLRPIELLADCGCLGPRTTVVHATHADPHELDLIAEAGYRYDSSYFGFKHHDRYGQISATIPPGEPVAEIRPGLLEIQMTRLPIATVQVPWAGGAYFRLIPYPVFRWGVAKHLRSNPWFTFYFHPWELDPDEVPPSGMPKTLRFRAYTGRGRTRRDLRRLVSEFGSCRIDEALRALGRLAPGGT